MFLTQSYRTVLTHWQQAGFDSFGARIFGSPIKRYCRWEDYPRVGNAPGSTAERLSNAASLYLPIGIIINPGDYIARGDYTAYGLQYTTDPRSLVEGYMVTGVNEVTTPSGNFGMLYVVFKSVVSGNGKD